MRKITLLFAFLGMFIFAPNVLAQAQKYAITAAESSKEAYGTNYANKAIDGNYSTLYYSNGAFAVDDYFQVNLGSVKPVGEIKLYFSTADRLLAADVQISEDRTSWTTVGGFTNGEALATYTCNAEGKTAQYVRIKVVTQNGNKWFQLVEFEVYEPEADDAIVDGLLAQATAVLNQVAQEGEVKVAGEKFNIAGKISTNAGHNTTEGNAQGYTDGAGIAGLTDNDPATYFHSRWGGNAVDADHYLQVDLGESLDEFIFEYANRWHAADPDNNSPAPTKIEVRVSQDGINFSDPVVTLTKDADGLPAYNVRSATLWRSDAIVPGQSFQHVRLTVTESNGPRDKVFGGHYFFGMGTLNMYQVTTETKEYGIVKDAYKGTVTLNMIEELLETMQAVQTDKDNGFVSVARASALEEKINAVISAAEQVSLGWTTTTSWTNITENTSTVLQDNILTGSEARVAYIETDLSVYGARTANVTFDYTSGNCALNVLGVEIRDAQGNVLAGDYHVGKTGDTDTDNVYTVKVAEAGTYKMRCYATFDGNNRANATNGNIAVSFTNADVSSFTHDVTFAAQYATLYLGYKVAIPEGVKAWAAASTNNSYVQFAEISTEISNVIPAATPVLLEKVGEDNTYTFAYSAETPATVGTNLLKGSIANCYVSDNAYVLGIIEGEIGFYVAEKNQQSGASWLNNAFKAYLPASAVNSNVKALRFNFGETTGIETLVPATDVNAPIYDLSGRRVLSTVKGGVYIQNGKKFIVK